MKKIVLYGLILFSIVSCSDTEKVNDDPKGKYDQPKSLEELANETRILVIDTDFSKGRLTNQQELTLWDVQKMHGHLCDGLVVGFLSLREGLYQLYPDSLIDRTNTRIVAKSSPCIGDIAVYLAGGRYQFNSFYIDNEIEGFYIVQRIDNGKTVRINLKKGVKPAEIDILGAKAVNQQLDACGLDSLKKMEDQFSRKLFSTQPEMLFEITLLDNFKWNPVLKNDFTKTDILNKNSSNCSDK